MRRQKHPATVHDESWMYEFPEGTDTAAERLLADDPAILRAGWDLTWCAFEAPTDRRSLVVELARTGRGSLRLRASASRYVDSDSIAADAPEVRYPDAAAVAAREVVDAAATHTAGVDTWIDLR
jgi:hypothetical protein